MTEPDRCHPVFDESGTVVASYHGQPMDERGAEAMRELVAAAQRHMDEQDPDGVMAARQRTAIERVRERARRLRERPQE